MDREALRKKLLDGSDAIISSLAWRFVPTDQQKMILAGRAFWARDTPVTDAALDDLLTLYLQEGGQ